jgi:arylsulfatase A-like enzyme
MDFVMETDWVVGEVLDELDKRGVVANTFFVFTSDNGCSPSAKIPELVRKGHDPCGPWRGNKADIYEGGHRVPFIVRWPGHVKPGTTSKQIISTVDFYATAADVLGKLDTLPENAAVDSFSLLPALRDPESTKPVRPFLVHHSINGSFGIRKGDWKLCLCPGSGGWSDPRPKAARKNPSLPPVQLFNLAEDPGETKNQIKEKPEVAEQLAKLLETAIRQGRTTPGPKQPNDGWPATTPKSALKLYPFLAPPKGK